MSDLDAAIRNLKFRADELIKASQEQREQAQRLRDEVGRVEKKLTEVAFVPRRVPAETGHPE
jgi:prefoldin subunit 5